MGRLGPSAKDAVYAGARWVAPRPRIVRAILMYHEVGGPAGPSADAFDEQMSELVRLFDVVVPLRQLPEAIEGGGSVAVVTFDDGYADTAAIAAPIMESHGIRATFFIPSGLIGSKMPTSYGDRALLDSESIWALASAGHEIGGHTLSHPRLTALPREKARDEIVEDRRRLRELLDAPVETFAYPKGDTDAEVRAMVREAGYRLAVTVRESLLSGKLDPWSLPRVMINAKVTPVQFRAKLSGAMALYERARGRR